MLNKKNLYGLNIKNPDTIICPSVDGEDVRLTREDFESEEVFRKWKTLSDQDYHEIEIGDHVERNHTISLYALSDEAAVTPAADQELIIRYNRQQVIRFNHEKIMHIQKILTARQFRRLWLHDALGWRETRIAEIENISQAAVSFSITSARKKVLKKFSPADKNYL